MRIYSTTVYLSFLVIKKNYLIASFTGISQECVNDDQGFDDEKDSIL